MAKQKRAATGPAVVAVKNLPSPLIESRAIAVPGWLTARCAVPAGDNRMAVAGTDTVELYAKRKRLAAVPCKHVLNVAAIHGGRVIVAATLRGDVVVYAVVDDSLAELARIRARIDGHTLAASGDRVFVSRATGSFEVVGLLPAYAGYAAQVPEVAADEDASGLVLVATRKVPRPDRFDTTGVDWVKRSGRDAGKPSAIAVRPDGGAAVVCWQDELWWAPATGTGKRIGKLSGGGIVGAELVGDDGLVVLSRASLRRFAVTPTSAKQTATLDVELGTALAVQRDRTRLVALVVEPGEDIGQALVFDATLRPLGSFDGIARVLAAGGRLFAFDRRSKAFEITDA